MHQAGLLNYALLKSKAAKNPCKINGIKMNEETNANNQPILLKLRNFGGAFLILCVGLFSAFLVFIGEEIIKYA